MWFLIDIVVAVCVAANIVKLVTGEPVIGQLDYLGASIGGIILLAIAVAMFAPIIPLPSFVLLMAGGVIGCCAWHTYKELF